jgi:hypothetical protein
VAIGAAVTDIVAATADIVAATAVIAAADIVAAVASGAVVRRVAVAELAAVAADAVNCLKADYQARPY